jgi:hypothetical protein
MNKTVVVYHSGYGHTQRVAQHVAEGAGGEALPIDAEGNLPEGGWEKLAAADAIIFGMPTYMGGRAGSSRNSPMPRPRHGSPAPGRTRCSAASPTAPARSATRAPR